MHITCVYKFIVTQVPSLFISNIAAGSKSRLVVTYCAVVLCCLCCTCADCHSLQICRMLTLPSMKSPTCSLRAACISWISPPAGLLGRAALGGPRPTLLTLCLSYTITSMTLGAFSIFWWNPYMVLNTHVLLPFGHSKEHIAEADIAEMHCTSDLAMRSLARRQHQHATGKYTGAYLFHTFALDFKVHAFLMLDTTISLLHTVHLVCKASATLCSLSKHCNNIRRTPQKVDHV